MRRILPLVAAIICLTFPACSNAAPRAEQFMLDGNLTEGEQVLLEHLADNPNDDEARFGLGVIQF